MESVQALLCQVGKLLYDRGYVAANDGNLSVRTEEGIWMTPSGVSKGRMTPDMMVLVDLEGNILSGTRYPSSEAPLHLEVYRRRKDVGAVVHAHPPVSTAFAACRKGLEEPLLAELVVGLGGRVPLAPYATLSTPAVPESIVPFVADYHAVLLANHGAVAWGADLWSAFDRLETVEHTARIYRNAALLGGGVPLSAEQVEELKALSGFYRRRAGMREEEQK